MYVFLYAGMRVFFNLVSVSFRSTFYSWFPLLENAGLEIRLDFQQHHLAPVLHRNRTNLAPHRTVTFHSLSD